MAPEESAEATLLLRSFERRFLAARALRCFPWQSLEEKLRDSGSELLLDILQKTVKHPLCVKHPPSVKYVRCFLSELIRKHEAVHAEPLDELYEALAEVLTAKEPNRCHRSYLLMCCIAQKLSSPWSGSCRGSLLAGRTSRLLTSMSPSPSATQRRASCSPPRWAGLGSHGKQCLVTTRNCFRMKRTQRWPF
ncbi:PREDICTED: protein-lysine N-methyltransferase EEF2KMT isoform X3 [Hipposideros armiger]|uniref:Protein-lysine N-methyltransferase EEF2KMT isoform X3 n=1 Tax=Hipposideros armiger TaxID=186990 RepID=A0A8B7SR84_HIPAR|nr:PREDICTED: protein-lysine N-methyltransferase EEF2KMT isoform X3 [Hipposideros armiger]